MFCEDKWQEVERLGFLTVSNEGLPVLSKVLVWGFPLYFLTLGSSPKTHC